MSIRRFIRDREKDRFHRGEGICIFGPGKHQVEFCQHEQQGDGYPLPVLPTWEERAAMMRRSSSRSASCSSLYLLFSSTTTSGSTNRVAPEEDWSCTIDLIWPLNSERSGST